MFDELNGWSIDGQVGDLHLALKEKRQYLYAGRKRLCLHERDIAKCGIILNHEIFRDQAGLHQREGKLTHAYIPAECAGQLRFYGRPEGVRIYEERYEKNDKEE